jgi:renal tumor antigen
MEFNFPARKYQGIASLISHVSRECQELILEMITYDPDNRPSASQIMKHPYFKDLRDMDKQHPEKPLPMENISQYS